MGANLNMADHNSLSSRRPVQSIPMDTYNDPTPSICACCRMNMNLESPQQCRSPTDACCGSFCPAVAKQESSNEDQIYTPAVFHQRHSLLRLQSQPSQSEESLIRSVVPPKVEPTLSQQELEERAEELAMLERSQEEDDAIRLMIASAKGGDPFPIEDSRAEDSA